MTNNENGNGKDNDYIKLKVGELSDRGDFGRGIVRLPSKIMKELKLKEGDVVELKGEKKTGAVAVRSYPADAGLEIVRMDGLVRKNCGVSISEMISIKKAEVKEAKKVTIAPLREDFGNVRVKVSGNASLGDIFKRKLVMRAMKKSDIFIPNPVVKQRKKGMNEDMFSSQIQDLMKSMGFDLGASPLGGGMFSFGNRKFVVTSTQPQGIVRITEATEIEFSEKAAEPKEAETISDVTYEDIGGLHEQINTVREMIELPLRHPELFEKIGIEPPKGVLMKGPPGTGKTLLAKAVANEAGANFTVINGPEIMCVSGDTKIFTNPEGYKTAKQIYDNSFGEVEQKNHIQTKKLNEPIKTYGFNDGEVKKTKITHAAKLKAPSYNVEINDGNEFTVSHNQPFLVYENGGLKWKRTEELSEGDYVARINNVETEEKSYDIPLDELNNVTEKDGKYAIKSRNLSRSNFIKLPKKTNPKLLEFLGFLVSEGNISKKGDAVTFSNSEERLNNRFKKLLKELFGITKTKKYECRLVVYSKLLVRYLKLLGISYKDKVSIPAYFFSLPKDEVESFVKGYMEGDGTISIVKTEKMDYPTPVLYSKSREFLKDFQSLLQIKLGITTRIKEHKTPKGKMNKLVVRGFEGRRKFSEISDEGPKFEKLREIKKTKRRKQFANVPTPSLLLGEIREKLPYKKYRNHDYYVYENGDFTEHALERLYEIAKKNGIINEKLEREFNILTRSDIAWEKVENIEYTGEKELYDFTADDDSFTAGMFLMHNSKFYGESESNLRKFFEEAEKNAPSIIFIDEIDAIASKRSETKGEVERRVVSQLLTLMDGLKARGKVIVIAATNIASEIDPALRRPGRFDREIEIGVPDKKGRKEVLDIHTRGMPLDKSVDLKNIAQITYGYVGADLEALAKEAAMHSLRRVLPDLGALSNDEPLPEETLKKLKVKDEDFDYALKMVEPSAMREVLVEAPRVTWDDIGGLKDVKETVKESVEWPLNYPDSFDRLGIESSKGIMLYGPPGCGKTLLAKAVANESNSNFILVKAGELLSKWVGESEKHVREVFKRAKQVAPSIIFFDEIDALTGQRGSNTGENVSGRVVSQILTEMSGLEDLHDVVVIAATNRPDIIDPALMRPGRFDKQILVSTPDKEARKRIFEIHTKDTPLTGDVDLESLAAQTKGYSGADIAAVCKEAAMNAMRKDKKADEVTKKDFENAVEEVKPSLSKEMNDAYEKMLGEKKESSMGEKEVAYTG